MPRVPAAIELDVMSSSSRRDTTSSGSSYHSSSSKDKNKVSTNPDANNTPGITEKMTKWACPVWVTCLFSFLSWYAKWNIKGGPKMVMTKVTISQVLAGLFGGGSCYLGLLASGDYNLCVSAADEVFFNQYKEWYDAHRRPVAPSPWVTNNTQVVIPKLPSVNNEPSRIKRMINAKNKAPVPRTTSVPAISPVSSEFMTDTPTPQVPTLPTDMSDAYAPTRPTAAAPPQPVHPGPPLPTSTRAPTPTIAVLRHAVKSEDVDNYSTASTPPPLAAPEILPTPEAPTEAWFTDYTSQLKTATIIGLFMSNVFLLAYLVGYSAGRKTWTWTPAPTRHPAHHDVNIDLVGPRYHQVQLEDRGLAGYDDDAYELPNPPDLPNPPRGVL